MSNKLCFGTTTWTINILGKKWRYYQITLKKLIIVQKIALWLYLLNYKYFGQTDDILILFWKSYFCAKYRFLALPRQISTFRVRGQCFDIDFCPKIRFFSLSSKLSTFKGKWRYFEIILKKLIFAKNSFLALPYKLSTFRAKRRYFEITWKNWFLPKNSFFGLSLLNYKHAG